MTIGADKRSSPARDGAPGAPPSALVGALVVAAALTGALLWITMVTGPLRFVSGLLETQDQLGVAQAALTGGANKKARLATLAADAASRRTRAGLQSGAPLFDLALASTRARLVLGEVGHIVRAAELSIEAAQGTLDISQNALKGPGKVIARDPDDPSGARIRIGRIEAVGATISDVREAVKGVGTELRAIDLAALPARLRPDVRAGIAQAGDSDEVLADAEAGFKVLPGILGADEPRLYMLGIQNSAELRGTGGSLLQFKLLELDNGAATLLGKRSGSGTIYKVDVKRRQLDIPLPQHAWYVRAIDDAKRAGNANWSPDWPSAARLTVRYAQASDARFPDQVDGVIAVDPTVLQELLPGVGRPRTGIDEVELRAGNIVNYVLYEAYARYPIPGIRRQRLGKLTNGFYSRLLKPERPAELIPGMGRALAHKHMQIWLAGAEEQDFIERMDWDGAIDDSGAGDYTMAVQQNVGGNKLDYFAEQDNILDIAIEGSDAVVANEVRITNGSILPLPRYFLGDSGPLHRPMINLYVPDNAALTGAEVLAGTRLDASPTPELAAWSGGLPPEHFEHGKKVWSTTLEIPSQQQGAVRFDYRVPGAVSHRDGRSIYRLALQHQPKVRPETFAINLSLPQGARDIAAPGWSKQAGGLSLERPLNRDVVLEVSWQE